MSGWRPFHIGASLLASSESTPSPSSPSVTSSATTSFDKREFRPAARQVHRAKPVAPLGQGWMATSPVLVQFQWSLLDKTGLQCVKASRAAASFVTSGLSEVLDLSSPSELSLFPAFEAASSENKNSNSYNGVITVLLFTLIQKDIFGLLDSAWTCAIPIKCHPFYRHFWTTIRHTIFAERKRMVLLGSGCGTVGRAVASDTRDTWFESSHRQFLFTVYRIEERTMRTKRGREFFSFWLLCKCQFFADKHLFKH